MGCCSKTRFSALCLCMSLALTLVCGFFASPAHACCGDAQPTPEMLCCDAAPQATLANDTGVPSDLKQAAVTAVAPSFKTFFVMDAPGPAMLAQRHTPDQSKRYLALRVLRN